MSRKARDLSKLREIAEASWLAKSHDLREKAAAERALVGRLEALAESKRHCLTNLEGAHGSADGQLVSTARWMRWAERERHKLNLELARVRADLLETQDVAREAFGRQHAVGKLAERLARKQRREG